MMTMECMISRELHVTRPCSLQLHDALERSEMRGDQE